METHRLALSFELAAKHVGRQMMPPQDGGAEQHNFAGSEQPEHDGDKQREGCGKRQKVQSKGRAHSNLLRRKQDKITFH